MGSLPPVGTTQSTPFPSGEDVAIRVHCPSPQRSPFDAQSSGVLLRLLVWGAHPCAPKCQALRRRVFAINHIICAKGQGHSTSTTLWLRERLKSGLPDAGQGLTSQAGPPTHSSLGSCRRCTGGSAPAPGQGFRGGRRAHGAVRPRSHPAGDLTLTCLVSFVASTWMSSWAGCEDSP